MFSPECEAKEAMNRRQREHNRDIEARANITAALERMPPGMRERTLRRMAIALGAAMGTEFRLNEIEAERGVALHPVERERAHRKAAERVRCW